MVKYSKTSRDVYIDIYCEAFRNPPYNYDWLKREKIERYFCDLEDTPNFSGFAYVERKVLAVCLGTMNDYFLLNKYYIKELVVRPEFQNKGVGTKMMLLMESYLKKNNVSAIDLLTSNDEGLLHYYKKNGFKVSENSAYMIKLL